jgi:hypothetical protein
MVRLVRFELTACSFGGSRSVQMSYRRKAYNAIESREQRRSPAIAGVTLASALGSDRAGAHTVIRSAIPTS